MEKLQVLEQCHSKVARKAKEEISSLMRIIAYMQAEIESQGAKMEAIMVELREKEKAYEDSQSLLAASREELNSTMVRLQAPMQITSQEEGKQMIRAGLHAVKSWDIVR